MQRVVSQSQPFSHTSQRRVSNCQGICDPHARRALLTEGSSVVCAPRSSLRIAGVRWKPFNGLIHAATERSLCITLASESAIICRQRCPSLVVRGRSAYCFFKTGNGILISV